MSHRIIVWAIIGLFCLAGTASAMSSANYALNWNVIGGGGGGSSSSSYMMQDTIGLLAGHSTSTNYRVQGGFWKMMTSDDTTAPASITNLHNTTYVSNYINWSWNDPSDSDFSHVLVYIDNVQKPNVSKGIRHYNATGLTADADHTISTRTVDAPGNVNTTWVNLTRRTAPGLGPLITVVSPNGGETFTPGSSMTISWSYTGTPGSTVKIELLKGITSLGGITTSIGSGGSGSATGTIPSGVSPGSDYKIRITSTSDPACTDTSDAPFTISGPSITVMSPNGGENWMQGSTHTLSWTYTGTPGTTVKIEALRGETVLAIVTPSTSLGSGGSGSYSLTFPYNTPLGSDYRIRITSTSNSAYTDTSDSPFTISADSSSSINVSAPNGGENWVQGSTHTLSWIYTGTPGSTVKIEALRGDTVLAVITPSTSIGSGGSGSYDLTFPFNTPLGSDYRIRVTSTSNPASTDTSDGQFTIRPAIIVTTPNGGENYPIGSSLPMSWTYSNNPGSTVNIDVFKGTTLLKTLTGIPIGTGGSGSYGVMIPASTPPGSDYKIRVTSASYGACTDMSDGAFAISAPG